MLMTVLKGDLATKQSLTIIRLFKKMKDYIIESNGLVRYNEIIRLTNKVSEHDKEIEEVKGKLETVMDNFINPSAHKHFLTYFSKKSPISFN